MDSEVLESEEEKKKKIEEREEILKLELSNMQRKEYKKELKESKEKDSSGRLEGNVVVEQTKESSPEKKQEYERVLIGKDRLSHKVFWEFGCLIAWGIWFIMFILLLIDRHKREY